jgi:hypothetical protein
MGYAQITSGRHRATASATAREPSSWRGTAQLRQLAEDPIVRGLRGGGVALCDGAAEALADRTLHGVTTPWPRRPWIRTSNTG